MNKKKEEEFHVMFWQVFFEMLFLVLNNVGLLVRRAYLSTNFSQNVFPDINQILILYFTSKHISGENEWKKKKIKIATNNPTDMKDREKMNTNIGEKIALTFCSSLSPSYHFLQLFFCSFIKVDQYPHNQPFEKTSTIFQKPSYLMY